MKLELMTARDHARFQAVKQRVFSEMREMGARKRLAVMVPFNAIVVAILASGGVPALRIGIHVAAMTTTIVGLTASERSSSKSAARAILGAAALGQIAAVWNTGGLSSPLLFSTIPFMVGCSMNPRLDKGRFVMAGGFTFAFAAMAIFADLAPVLAWGKTAYAGLTFLSVFTAVFSLFKMGRGMTAAYERIAFELAERREELCDESEGRTRALEGIAARLAHEVKNPLAAIKGLSTHVARQAEDPKVKERLSIVAAEAERLQEIVEGFLSFSRGLDELAVAPTKPYEIAHELELLLETRAADSGVKLEVRGSRELTVEADGKKLRQALLNLVLNAMQASTSGSAVTVDVAKSCGDGAAVVKVTDHGAGMTPDVLDRIAKPYYTTKEGGSGLGIAVARGIIEQHGGTLKFESRKGHGTTATLTLPASAHGDKSKFRLPGCRDVEAVIKAPAVTSAANAVGAAGAAVGAAVSSVTVPEKVTT